MALSCVPRHQAARLRWRFTRQVGVAQNNKECCIVRNLQHSGFVRIGGYCAQIGMNKFVSAEPARIPALNSVN